MTALAHVRDGPKERMVNRLSVNPAVRWEVIKSEEPGLFVAFNEAFSSFLDVKNLADCKQAIRKALGVYLIDLNDSGELEQFLEQNHISIEGDFPRGEYMVDFSDSSFVIINNSHDPTFESR